MNHKFGFEPKDDLVWAAIQAARLSTGRSKVLRLNENHDESLIFDSDFQSVTPLKPSLLCRAIAESDRRIAAIVISPAGDDPLIFNRYLKRVADLANAEGAVLVLEGVQP